jgi:protein phosphatase
MQKELEFYQLTAVGNREVNQDCMAHRVCADYAVFVVADGLGGHHAGEKASQYFCRALLSQAEFFSAQIKSEGPPAVKEWLVASVKKMRELFADDPAVSNAHTTCAILYLDRTRVITIHCGDSRIYRLNAEQVLWRTRDHSVIQQLFEEGLISEREMGLHPEQNRLNRSINALVEPWVDIQTFPPLQKGETFLLCSDGFWEQIKEQELLQLSQPQSGKSELKKMAQMTILRAQGRSDNVTVQWVRKR